MSLHPSHRPDMVQSLWTIALLVAGVVCVGLAPEALRKLHIPNHLTWHMGLETLSFCLSAMVFVLLFSLRDEPHPLSLSILASTLLGASLFDFWHMLSLDGMPDFITPSGSNKSIFFWLWARLLTAMGVLAVAFLSWQRQSPRHLLSILTVLVLLFVLAVHTLYFRFTESMPQFFIFNRGLTPIKIYSEYALMLLFAVAAIQFAVHLHRPRIFNASNLFAATLTMMLSEYFFTQFSATSDAHMLIGHVYKVVAHWLLYRAVLVETVRHPYRAMRASATQLQATLDALPDLVFELDEHGRYLNIHASTDKVPANEQTKLLGHDVSHTLAPQDSQIVMHAIGQAARNGVAQGHIITMPIDGQPKQFELSTALKQSTPGQPKQFIMISRDVTERLRNETILNTLVKGLMQSPIGFVLTDTEYRIKMCNTFYANIVGGTPETLKGQRPSAIPGSRTPASTWQAIRERVSTGRPWRGELIRLSPDGREHVLSTLIIPILDQAGQISNYFSHVEDITEKKQAAEQIRVLSEYNQITGLPNRDLLQEHFHYTSQQTDRIAALWIDLDHFKDVNDVLGHPAGDTLLTILAQRMRRTLHPRDILGHLSGDDFLALLPGATQQEAATRAQHLLNTIVKPAMVSGRELSITASIGIALYPSDANQFDSVLRLAETAMYRAKHDGRNHSCFFTPDIQSNTARILALSNALNTARQRNEFRLVYQPQIYQDRHRVFGAEALLRWYSPELGEISPAEFIPIAESSGQIVSIGEWVVETAINQLQQWQQQGLDNLTMSVNLSAVQFNQPDLPTRILNILKRTDVAPERLTLEITEAVAMKGSEQAIRQIHALTREGIRIAIDDFGTGYSSLSYLKRFNIHKLKIDQSFVRDLTTSADDQAIVLAIIRMARSLGIGIIAEGVETVAQCRMLQDYGCQTMQGFLFSPALEPEAFERFVREYPQRYNSDAANHGKDAC